MEHFHDLLDDLKEPTRSLSRAIPDAWAGFAHLHQAAMADGALPARTKELMALLVAVVKGCEGCIGYHAKAAARRGATAEEVAETLAVALLMDGGTASTHGPTAWAAFSELSAPVPVAGAARAAS